MISLFLLITISLVFHAQGQESDTLMDNLFANYDSRIRPFEGSAKPVIITVRLTVGMLIDLASDAQTADFNMAQYWRWQDPRLAWNPAQYNNITQIFVPYSLLWQPKLFVYNGIKIRDYLINPDALIDNNGNITVYLAQYVNTVCSVDMTRFPFDTQYVFIGQVSALLPIEVMDAIVMEPPPLDQSYFLGNSEFDVMNITTNYRRFQEEGRTRFAFEYIFELKRRSIYYTTVIIVPVFLSMVIHAIGIFSPGTTPGESIAISLATLFTLMILLGIVADAMPKSDTMSIIGIYILVMILLCTFGIIISNILRLIIGHISCSKSRPPKCLRLLFRIREKNQGNTEKNHMHQNSSLREESNIKNGIKNSSMTNEVQVYTKDLARMMVEIQSTVNQMFEDMKKTSHSDRNEQQQHHHQNHMNEEWEYIFLRIRYFLIFLFEVFNVVNLLVYFRYGWISPPGRPEKLL